MADMTIEYADAGARGSDSKENKEVTQCSWGLIKNDTGMKGIFDVEGQITAAEEGGPQVILVPVKDSGPFLKEHYNTKCATIVGAILVGCGVVEIACHSVLLAVPTTPLFEAGHGYWGGLLYLITGCFTIAAAKYKTTCQIITALVLGVLCCPFSVMVLTVSIVSLIVGSYDYSYYRNRYDYWDYTRGFYNHTSGMYEYWDPQPEHPEDKIIAEEPTIDLWEVWYWLVGLMSAASVVAMVCGMIVAIQTCYACYCCRQCCMRTTQQQFQVRYVQQQQQENQKLD